MNKFLCILGLAFSLETAAQTFNHYITTEQISWQKSTQKLENKASTTPLMTVSATEKGHEFLAWGTCFNELNYDALLLLKPEEREKTAKIVKKYPNIVYIANSKNLAL